MRSPNLKLPEPMPSSPRMDSPEELLDLVGINDQVIGVIEREEVLDLEQNKKGYVRNAGIFLVNGAREIWIPTRQPYKKIAPNGYDFSANGHVGSGQTYESAALQELEEELGIKVKPDELTYIGTTPPVPGMPYFSAVYTCVFNGNPIFNTDDFSTGSWMNIRTLIADIQSGHPAKEVLSPALDLLLTR